MKCGTVYSTYLPQWQFVPFSEDEWIFNPTANSSAQEVTLRGINEVLAINLNSTTVSEVGRTNFNVPFEDIKFSSKGLFNALV